jgi:predicted metal-dependent phosphoesterase TrpH
LELEIAMSEVLQVEFHCHTLYSKDSLTEIKALLLTCQRKGIDRLAITDHNRIEGARLAYQMDPERVIVGEELMTTRGELLAFYVKEEIPKGLEPEEAIHRLRDQGAFISVSHPFDRARSGAWVLPDLERITPLVDAIETFNARCLNNQANLAAQAYARAHHLAGTSGSDAHILMEVGAASQKIPYFDTPDQLKQVIWQAQPNQTLSPFWVHFASTYAKFRKKLASSQVRK